VELQWKPTELFQTPRDWGRVIGTVKLIEKEWMDGKELKGEKSRN